MELASIVDQYYDRFMEKYGQAALPGHLSALRAIHRCRTPASGEFYVQCPGCQHAQWKPLSCENRICPKCQNHEAGQFSAPAVAAAQLKTEGRHFMRKKGFLKTCIQVAAYLRPAKIDLPGFAPFAPCLKINIFL